LWIQHGVKLILLLPGPPRELKPMIESVIQERLLGYVGASRLFRRLLRITGQSESSVEEKMQPLYARWLAAPTRITTTILASLGQIELHLTALASSADAGHRALDGAVADVRAALGRDLFSTNNETMQQVVGALLRERGFTIAAAESCTGGLVMARLTEVPGSSDYVDRGVVVYTNQSKTDLLNVPAQLIEAHGAVSEPVAQAMASRMVRLAATNFALGITGVAGPTGGTSEKPVGMVVIATAWARNNTIDTRVRTFNFIGGREMVRFQASQAALDMVRRWMLE
jgi:nicotinamide-nucleotide amidase